MNGVEKMLAEERFGKILNILEEEGSVEVSVLMEKLHTSESTIRRDLNTMDAKGLLTKVHGGAVKKKNSYRTKDDLVDLRKEQHVSQKKKIAHAAAQRIEDDDVIYIDAGTTTDFMITDNLNKHAVYVTNAVGHAKKLSGIGCRVYLLGGEFKGATDAIVGEEAVCSLDKYNFTKGFFGTNGITVKQGFTTPEVKEALIKQRAMEHAKEVYILADSSKFSEVSSVTFGRMEEAVVLTEKIPEEYKGIKNIKEVGA